MRWIVSFAALSLLACDEKKPAPGAAASEAGAPSVIVDAAVSAAAAPSAAAPKTAPEAVAAQHVLVAYKGAKGAPKTIARTKVEAKKRAEEVVAKAKAGADFAALAAEYSDDPGSKDRLGSVGKFTREKMTKPFSDAAFSLAVDEVSGPVESDFGFHVIKRNQ
ncbi:MAG TPA: peptidylprolyl isomerase [Labilithrix sp.]|nr:peptidylprolyl isomerase [Labilithrix sp.]